MTVSKYTEKLINVPLEKQREQVKRIVGQKINAALLSAQTLSPDDCLGEIKTRLLSIQIECQAIGKSFIVVEERVTCSQHQLKGYDRDKATLFRGPSENASVAICVTDKGSLLHRNGDCWRVYKDAGDVNVLAT
ncbi:hypothetical protein ACKFKG_07900 [Phormidesmis sp. 146-35]